MKEMKTFRFIGMVLTAILLSVSFAACGGDDDEENGGSIESAKYASDAAKFNITDGSSNYSSIELTEGGNYIIIMNDRLWSPNTRATGKQSFARMFMSQVKNITRGSESGILYGTYTKSGDGEYYLEDFGTLKIVSEDGTAVSLEVTPIGGTTQTISGNRESTASDSQLTRNLCRTWQFAKYTYYYKLNGKTIMEVSGATIPELAAQAKAWAKAHDPEYDESDYEDELGWDDDYYPESVVFTRSGTYMVYYTDSSVAVVGWKWLSESEGLLQYDWGYDFEEEDTGVAYVSFSGSKLILTEKSVETDEDDTEEVGIIYTMTELK